MRSKNMNVDKKFKYIFRVSEKTFFMVNVGGQKYRKIGDDDYFSTSALVLSDDGRCFDRVGQFQEDVLVGPFLDFYERYKKYHLCYISNIDSDVLCDIYDELEVLAMNTYICSICQSPIINYLKTGVFE